MSWIWSPGFIANSLVSEPRKVIVMLVTLGVSVGGAVVGAGVSMGSGVSMGALLGETASACFFSRFPRLTAVSVITARTMATMRTPPKIICHLAFALARARAEEPGWAEAVGLAVRVLEEVFLVPQ